MRSDDQGIDQLRRQTYRHMRKSRPGKYEAFTLGLRSLKYVPGYRQNGKLLESVYTALRQIDDVVDGDSLQPAEGVIPWVQARREILQNCQSPVNDVDRLLAYSRELGIELGRDVVPELDDMIGSMEFDARRRGKWSIYSKKELEHHFYLLDIRGTIQAALFVFKEDPLKYKNLSELGWATRIYYNLRDIDEDLEAGFVNIPAEEILQYRIPVDQRLTSNNNEVQKWMSAQSVEGLKLLERHHKQIEGVQLRGLGRLVLSTVYERPARKFFQRQLSANSPAHHLSAHREHSVR